MEQKYPIWHPYRWIGRSKFQKVDRGDVKPGAISIDTSLPGITGIAGELRTSLGIITPLIPREYIDLLFTLSVTSPLISETIYDNITLANSGHHVRIEGAGDAVIERAAESLQELAVRMHTGGADGWFRVAMYQLLVTGALSHEWVIEENLDGVVRSKFVPVQTIKFHKGEDPHAPYIPFQHAQGIPKELNPITYHYRPLIQWENNPYGIPPLFAAIEPTWVMREVMGSIRGISKKFGLLGLFNILLKRPDQDHAKSETDAAYAERLKKYLEEAKKSLEKSFNDGILIGYQDQHEFKHDSVTGDARGLSDLYKQIDLEAMSGANTDPALHGRDMSRTETQIRQVYQKLVRQLSNIRNICSRSIEYGYQIHLMLAGFPELTVSLDWEPIDSLDSLRDEQVFMQEILNARMLYEDGLISQEERAQMLGFDGSDQDKPRLTKATPSGGGGGEEEAEEVRQGGDAFEYCPDWPPDDPHDLDLSHAEFAESGKIVDLIDKYVASMTRKVVKAGNGTMILVREFLRTSARRTSPEIFADHLYRVLANEFEAQMSTPAIRAEIAKFAEKIYREALLGEGFERTMGAIAGDFKPIFDVKKDVTTLNFLEETDFFYMGKFIKRGDTADRMKRRIINDYIAVGRDYSDKKFVDGVAKTLGLEYHQAERIIRTTANMSRNFASLRMMEQSQVVQVFEVVGPLDRITCDWCEGMVGRTFRVARAILRMREVIDAGPENVPDVQPFLTSRLTAKEVSKDEGMTDAQIAAEGFDKPPYHPRCRHRIVAVA
jgi:hypothetical protein